jgi:spermidine synthase
MKQPGSSISTPILVGVAGCFLLSGFAALLYQMAWMRQFSTVFGTSETAVATVLSAYMGGLALGAALAGRLVQLIRRPVLFYGFLEAAIAISALLVPVLLSAAGLFYAAILGNQASIPDAAGWGQPLFYFFVAFAVLIVPTACMGATLPVLTRYVVARDDQIGRRVGGLYAINTLGAVGGAVVAGFILLPNLGLRGTVWCGVFVNVLVFITAVLVARASSSTKAQEASAAPVEDVAAPETVDPTFRLAWMILPIMTLSGVCTFVYEVLWTRLLSHILGGSVAAFALMLASFLSGIALGSLIASRFARSRAFAAHAFIVSQLAIATTSMLVYYSLNGYVQAGLDYQANVLVAFLVLMPATLFIGATFPLAVRIYAAEADVAARSSARVYAWNTLGAIVGAAIAGFLLVPLLKYEGAVRVMVVLNLGLAVAAATMLPTTRRLPLGLATAALGAAAILYFPSAPERILRFSPMLPTATGDMIFYDVGRTATVLVFEQDGEFHFRSNGLPEATAAPLGTPPMLDSQHLLGTFPVLIRPDSRSALIVGLGAGKAVTGVPPTVEEIDVIELEPKVIAANEYVSARRDRNPLDDPRLSVYINDARSALALTSRKYDVIISQPSHPWSAGASHLYTVEYMQLVADHLNEGGIFLQWINTQFVDEALLKNLCATILDVYPHVRVYQLAPQVLFFVASDRPMDVEREILATGRPFKDAPLFYLEQGVAAVEDVVAALMMDQQGIRDFSAGSRVITDDFNMMAMESAAVIREGRELNVSRLAKTLRPWVPALDGDSWVHELPDEALQYSRIVDKYVSLQIRGLLPDLVGALNDAGNPQALLVAGLIRDGEGKPDEARELFTAAIEAMPNSNPAKYALVEPWLRTLGREQAPEEIAAIASSMTGSGRAVIEASRAVAQRDLQTVADLDRALAAAGPADPWFTEAVKLRIDWRSSVSNPELTKQFSEQAWRILDLAMANRNDHEFFAMRIFAASRADRHNEVIQTARGYIKAVEFLLTGIEEGYISPAGADLDLKIRQLNAIAELVIRASAVVNAATRDELEVRLERLSERLSQSRSAAQ